MKLHFPTCSYWITEDCTCRSAHEPVWRIQERPGELFPWDVERRTGNGEVYERLMSCSTYTGAMELVSSLIWLTNNGLRSESV